MSGSFKGEIELLVPIVKARVREGILVLDEGGDLSLTLDTGFSGPIALPDNLLDDIGVELVGFSVFRMANGDQLELPVHWGKVVVGDQEVETWFIPGDSLLGMELLSLIGSEIILDLDGDRFEITLK